jgi:hypothetical protein
VQAGGSDDQGEGGEVHSDKPTERRWTSVAPRPSERGREANLPDIPGVCEGIALSGEEAPMAEITLAKALKVKNRLTGRLAKAQADIQAYNSVPEGQADQVNVPALMQTCEEPGIVFFKIAWAMKYITHQFPFMGTFQKRILSIVWPAIFDTCVLASIVGFPRSFSYST